MEYVLRNGETETSVDVIDTGKLEKDREDRLRAYQYAMEEIQKRKSENQ